MMRISEALIEMGKKAELEDRPLPVISVPKEDIAGLAWAIEADLNGAIYRDINPYDGFKFFGIEFKPS